MLITRRLVPLWLILLLCAGLSGCGGTDKFFTSNNGQNPVPVPTVTVTATATATVTTTPSPSVTPTPRPTATVRVIHVLARAVPSDVESFRFTAFDEDGQVVFGPVTRNKTATIDLTGVPITAVRMQIEYFEDTLLVGIGSSPMTLEAGELFIISDPFFDVTAPLTEIEVEPASASIPDGTAQQFTANATFADGNEQNVTSLVTWTSTETGVATISNAPANAGQALAISTGQTTIRATLLGISDTSTLNVTAATLENLVVEGENDSIPIDGTSQFTATATSFFRDCFQKKLITRLQRNSRPLAPYRFPMYDDLDDEIEAALDLDTEVQEDIESLSVDERLVMEALALAGQGLLPKELSKVLSAGPLFDKKAHPKILASLRAKDMLSESFGHLVCPNPLCEPLAIRAKQEGRAAALIVALRKLDKFSEDPWTVARHLRFALYSGDFDLAELHAKTLGKLHISFPWAEIGRWFVEPSSYLVFPNDLASKLIRQTLMASINEPFPAFPALGALKHRVQSGQADAEENFLFAHQLMMRAYGKLLDQHLKTYPAPVVDACRKICDGDLKGLEFMCALLKSGASLPYFTAGFLYLVAFIAREGYDSPLLRQEVRRFALFRDAFDWLIDVKLGKTSQISGPVNRMLEEPPVGTLPHLLSILYLAGFARDQESKNQASQAAQDYNEAGYYIFAEWLGWIAGEAPANSQPPPLFRLIDQKDDRWRHVLGAISTLCAPSRPSPSQAEERLIWLIEPFVANRKVEPRLQKLGKNGSWSSGLLLKLEEVWRDPPACADSHDRKVFQAFRDLHAEKPQYGYVSRTDLIEAALLALVGHPRVMWIKQRYTPVDLLEAPVIVSVISTCQGFEITMDPLLKQPMVHAHRDSAHGPITLSRFTKQHWQLATLLGDQLLVPPEGEEMLRPILGGLAAVGIAVNSDLGLGSEVEEKPADPTLVVRLSPLGDGLSAQIRVMPLGSDGPSFVPGEGSKVVAVRHEQGTSVQASRNLQEESSRLLRLRELHPGVTGVEIALPFVTHGLEFLERFLDLPPDIFRLEWPEGVRFQLRARIGKANLSPRVSSGTDWLAVGGEVRVDEDQVMSLGELLTRWRQSDNRFITLDDGALLALTKELDDYLLRLNSMADKFSGDELLMHPLVALSLLQETEATGDSGWDQLSQRLYASRKLKPRLPKTFIGELRPYQLEGYRWLVRMAHWGVGACLADDMGLGKTIQILALLLSRASQGPALVVAPTSVCWNWMDEAARFAPALKVHYLAATSRTEALASPGPGELVLCSYGLMVSELESLSGVAWATMVLDEAQAIKNRSTHRAKAAFALRAEFRVAATGTPVENHIDELWSLFRYLNPGMLGSRKAFADRFVGTAGGRQELSRQVRPFILRRTKDQVLQDLPPRTDILEKLPLSAEERALYEAMRREAVQRLEDGEENYLSVLVQLTRLRQACCHARLVAPGLAIPSTKVSRFVQLVEELLDNGHRALVFSQFVSYLTILKEELDKRSISYQYLDGSTPPAARQKAVKAFQGGQGSLFLISLKAGGTGLNLTAADYVIHMDPWWNPAVEDQASDRAHRIGQNRPVTVYRLVTQDTVEERIVTLHLEKRDLARRLLDGTDTASRLSAGELLELLGG